MKPSSQQAARSIRQVTWAGMFINAILTVGKLFAGIYGNSQALIADAIHSISDLVTDVAVLVGMYFWTQPADDSHPYGHGKIEMLVTLFIGAALALVGFELINHAVTTLYRMIWEEQVAKEPSMIAFYVALVSICSKELLYRWTRQVGKKTGSQVLVANAWHHRSDALSSIPAAIAVLTVIVLGPNFCWADPVGAILVSLLIFHAAWQIVRPALVVLLDNGMTKAQLNEIQEIAGSVEGVDLVHQIRTRPTGAGTFVLDLHVHVDGTLSVSQGHDIAEVIEKKILSGTLPISDVLVHIEPRQHGEAKEKMK